MMPPLALQREDYWAVIDSLNGTVTFLTAQVRQITDEITALIEQCPELCERSSILESVSGVGATTAATLLAHVPELGYADRGQIAALVDVPALTRESGNCVGQRFSSGGRIVACNALYMAALSATRFNATIREY